MSRIGVQGMVNYNGELICYSWWSSKCATKPAFVQGYKCGERSIIRSTIGKPKDSTSQAPFSEIFLSILSKMASNHSSVSDGFLRSVMPQVFGEESSTAASSHDATETESGYSRTVNLLHHLHLQLPPSRLPEPEPVSSPTFAQDLIEVTVKNELPPLMPVVSSSCKAFRRFINRQLLCLTLRLIRMQPHRQVWFQ